MTALVDFFVLTDAFGAARGIGEARVSTLVFNDGKRLRDLRAGEADIGVRRLATAIQFLSNRWPNGAIWPEGIPRPTPAEATPEPVR